MQPHRIKGIYLRFDSPSVIRYKLPHKDDILKAQFRNCKFIETSVPGAMSRFQSKRSKPLNFKDQETVTLIPDPRTALTDVEVRKLLDLQALADKIPGGFQSGPGIVHSPVPGAGNPVSEAPSQKQRKTANPYTRASLHVNHIQSEASSDIPWDDHETFVTRLTNLEPEPQP